MTHCVALASELVCCAYVYLLVLPLATSLKLRDINMSNDNQSHKENDKRSNSRNSNINSDRNNSRNSKRYGPPRKPGNKFFKVHTNYTDDFPTFEKPKIAGYWSIDGSRKLHFDSSQLRYYVPRNEENLKLDLNEGLSEVIRRPDSVDNEGIDHLLKWIEANRKRLLSTRPESTRWLQPYFICYRGTLTKILRSPYNGSSWIICAAKWRGSIYLSHYQTDYDKVRKADEKVVNNETSYWGGKFRQYMFSEDPTKPPDTSKPINESEKFYCVFRARLNKHSLLYRSEVDGVCSNRKLKDPLPFNRLKFIKVRTGKLSETPEQKLVREKLRNIDMWSQTYLSGVEKIERGLREDCDGIVRRIVKTSRFEIVKDSEKYWDPKICLKFGDEFLKFIYRTVRNDCDKTIYKFERRAFKDVFVTELPPTSEYAFLPDWYKALPEN